MERNPFTEDLAQIGAGRGADIAELYANWDRTHVVRQTVLPVGQVAMEASQAGNPYPKYNRSEIWIG
jgi:hypothetical protein